MGGDRVDKFYVLFIHVINVTYKHTQCESFAAAADAAAITTITYITYI